MTSRFYKSYSRKGGDGTSKFDEVFSNKKTMSTKWGETTYRAKLTSKRFGLLADGSKFSTKRSRLANDDSSEDPFGFDSDDESKPRPVSSRGQNRGSPARAERPPSLTLEPNSRVSEPASVQAVAPSRGPSGLGSAGSSHRVPEDLSRLFGSNSVGQSQSQTHTPLWLGDSLDRHKNWYQNVSDSSRPPPSRVFIQDHIECSMDKLNSGGSATAIGVATAADPGEVGRLRTKTKMPTTKPARPGMSKSETWDCWNGLFDCDDEDSRGDDLAPSGFFTYEIQYLGYGGLRESDKYEDEDSKTRMKILSMPAQPSRRERKTEGAKVSALDRAVSVALTAATTATVSPPVVLGTTTDRLTSSGSRTGPAEVTNEWLASSKALPTPQDQVEEYTRKIFRPKKSPTKAVYNARHWNQREEEELPPPTPPSQSQTTPASGTGSSGNSGNSGIDSNSHKDDGVVKALPPPTKDINTVTTLTEPNQDTVTALKEDKKLCTVVRRVKDFNEAVEYGEKQEFEDDIKYLAAGLKTGVPLKTRCLSVISLSSRCATSSFRMHLRAGGKVAQTFKLLSDAPQYLSLALCTASLMYILSRDRLNMDLDRDCLELLIRLLRLEQEGAARAQLTTKEMAKVKEKIRKLCQTVHNEHLDLENITTEHLAMETLLSLTSRRVADWFKEELRLLGGLDHIVDKVKECVDSLSEEEDKEKLVASLWGVERCLRVLESVTLLNPANQSYLIGYKDSQLIVFSVRALRHCEDLIKRYSREVNCSAGTTLPYCSNSNVGKAVEDCLRISLSILLNLTHDNEWGSNKAGEQEDLISTALSCVLRVPQYLPQEQRYDMRLLGLALLTNLVEHSAMNCLRLGEMQLDGYAPLTSLCLGEKEELSTETPLSAIAVLVQLFLQGKRAAMLAEAQTDNVISEVPKAKPDQSGEWQESAGEIQWVATDNPINDKDMKKQEEEEEEEELNLNKALHHAGKHMEDSMLASYTAVLLGCLCQGSPMNLTAVRENLPKGDFSIMTEMLKKYLDFMYLTSTGASAELDSVAHVIGYLERC